MKLTVTERAPLTFRSLYRAACVVVRRATACALGEQPVWPGFDALNQEVLGAVLRAAPALPRASG